MFDDPGRFQFFLRGISLGGRPTTIIWRKDGVQLPSTGPYTISDVKLMERVDPCLSRLYFSELHVVGRLPGEYSYTVDSGASPSAYTSTYTVEGTVCRNNSSIPIHFISLLDRTIIECVSSE